MNRGHARQVGGQVERRGAFLESGQHDYERTLGIAQIGLVDLGRSHEAAAALTRIQDLSRTIEQESRQVLPTLLANALGFEMARIVRGNQLFNFDGSKEIGDRIEVLRLLGHPNRRGGMPRAQVRALDSRMRRTFHV